ncbi:YggS family pyridoxal phosphate-dependent enzyme [uncultured Desulfuromusa sp.]|uniref:YggS family pyridoxal phosphate-dependent enzyme n=1 Tax=uncultured Desulfuromusa sp. TaxID=219183 RepID=UPI002AA651E4|nr:YggS family pyridoxal phosphate-dependent enzyme [uncultured Desulfuromusa sp.]
MNNIADNIQKIHARINNACQISGRNPEEVKLVAVSKIKPADMIEEAFHSGQKIFGESYVQEFRDKHPLVSAPVEWHFIGGLQSNKVKYLRGKVSTIHSVDRLSLAQEIDRQWGKTDKTVDIFLQVNVGDESSKAGCSPEELESLVRSVAPLPNLKIKGLMCLPPHFDDPELVRPFFKQLKELAEQINNLHLPAVSMDELSMGMSGDFEVAVEEGATFVRIGTAIFGARTKKA